jgi:hypothetical protein
VKFSAAQQADMLDAVGVAITIGGATIQGDFQAPGEVLDQFEELIVTRPTVLFSGYDVAALSIVGGEFGTAMTIDGMDYVVLSIVPDGSGFYMATLEAV